MPTAAPLSVEPRAKTKKRKRESELESVTDNSGEQLAGHDAAGSSHTREHAPATLVAPALSEGHGMAQSSKSFVLREPESEAQRTKKRSRLEAGPPSGPHGPALPETNSRELQGRESQRSKTGSGVLDGTTRCTSSEDASRSISPPFGSSAPAEAKQLVLSEGDFTVAKVPTASTAMTTTSAASSPPISDPSSSRCSSSPLPSSTSSVLQQPSSGSSRVSKAPPLSASSSATPTAPRFSPASSTRVPLGVAPAMRTSLSDSRALLSTSSFPPPRVFPGLPLSPLTNTAAARPFFAIGAPGTPRGMGVPIGLPRGLQMMPRVPPFVRGPPLLLPRPLQPLHVHQRPMPSSSLAGVPRKPLQRKRTHKSRTKSKSKSLAPAHVPLMQMYHLLGLRAPWPHRAIPLPPTRDRTAELADCEKDINVDILEAYLDLPHLIGLEYLRLVFPMLCQLREEDGVDWSRHMREKKEMDNVESDQKETSGRKVGVNSSDHMRIPITIDEIERGQRNGFDPADLYMEKLTKACGGSNSLGNTGIKASESDGISMQDLLQLGVTRGYLRSLGIASAKYKEEVGPPISSFNFHMAQRHYITLGCLLRPTGFSKVPVILSSRPEQSGPFRDAKAPARCFGNRLGYNRNTSAYLQAGNLREWEGSSLELPVAVRIIIEIIAQFITTGTFPSPQRYSQCLNFGTITSQDGVKDGHEREQLIHMILFVLVEAAIRHSCLGALKFTLEAYTLWIRDQWHRGNKKLDAFGTLIKRLHRVWRVIASFDPKVAALHLAFKANMNCGAKSKHARRSIPLNVDQDSKASTTKAGPSSAFASSDGVSSNGGEENTKAGECEAVEVVQGVKGEVGEDVVMVGKDEGAGAKEEHKEEGENEKQQKLTLGKEEKDAEKKGEVKEGSKEGEENGASKEGNETSKESEEKGKLDAKEEGTGQ